MVHQSKSPSGCVSEEGIKTPIGNQQTPGMVTRYLSGTGFQSGLPLYKKVRNQIVNAIRSGEWRAGDVMPNEKRLCSRFGVSIGTLRKAVDELTSTGILVRQQGRGTFVARHSEDRYLFSFFHLACVGGRKEYPELEFLSFRTCFADECTAKLLDIQVGARLIHICNRLSLEGWVVSLDDIYLPADLFPDLDQEIVCKRTTTLYQLYQDECDITIVRTLERLRVGISTDQQAGLLNIAPNTPLLCIMRIAYTFEDQPAELRLSYANTERCEYIPGNFVSPP